jgi:protoporphyrin/coproporphyrin ferrochelatase
MRTAILLINLGTPNDPGPSAVARYLGQFLNDRRVIDIHPVARFFLVNFVIIPFRSFRSSKLYKAIWTGQGSPLLLHTIELRNKLRKQLPASFLIECAMRYQEPSIASALESIRLQHPDRIKVIPLYPQYASSSTGSTLEEVMRCVRKWEVIPAMEFISKFYDHPAFLKAVAQVTSKFDITAFDHVIFSYHGLPERQILKASVSYGKTCSLGDCCNVVNDTNRYCYRAACFETTRRLVSALNIPSGKFTTSFQSRLNDKWLKPYSDKVIEDFGRSGLKRLLVLSPAFVADCLETIYEIGVEYNEIFRHHGGENVTLVPALNATDVWVEALAEILHTTEN